MPQISFLHGIKKEKKKKAAEYFAAVWDSDICWNVIFPFSAF
jgi:hypothetical protein